MSSRRGILRKIGDATTGTDRSSPRIEQTP
jgi:hypothetical protein